MSASQRPRASSSMDAIPLQSLEPKVAQDGEASTPFPEVQASKSIYSQSSHPLQNILHSTLFSFIFFRNNLVTTMPSRMKYSEFCTDLFQGEAFWNLMEAKPSKPVVPKPVPAEARKRSSLAREVSLQKQREQYVNVQMKLERQTSREVQRNQGGSNVSSLGRFRSHLTSVPEMFRAQPRSLNAMVGKGQQNGQGVIAVAKQYLDSRRNSAVDPTGGEEAKAMKKSKSMSHLAATGSATAEPSVEDGGVRTSKSTVDLKDCRDSGWIRGVKKGRRSSSGSRYSQQPGRSSLNTTIVTDMAVSAGTVDTGASCCDTGAPSCDAGACC
ncbi:MAG: hypothetical protein L6R40_003567 [Gallowayella cf. fulva]|nr:MAG: hypothetical protein L6R40_003567 [Xanthomendoza cf. fulva]